MTSYEFWLKVIDKLPTTIAAFTSAVGAVVSLVILWKQKVNKVEIKSDIQNAKDENTNAILDAKKSAEDGKQAAQTAADSIVDIHKILISSQSKEEGGVGEVK